MRFVEFSPSDFDLVTPLFGDHRFDRPIIQAILEGRQQGWLVAEDAARPTLALLAHRGGERYFGGSPANGRGEALFASSVARTLLSGDGELLLATDDKAWASTISNLFKDRARHFGFRTFGFSNEAARAALSWTLDAPEGCDLQLVKGATIDRCSWLQRDVKRNWGAAESYVAGGGPGFAVLRNGEVLSTCISHSVGGGMTEADVETTEEHRRKGYALAVSRAFVSASLKSGLMPAWTCDVENRGSHKLAAHLGFQAGPVFDAFWLDNAAVG